jgi:DNA-directed RNA polymerase II subunit RPB2
MRYNAGECRNDPGGYFIIDGKEKVVISQEKFADNALYVHNHRRDLKDMDDDEELVETTSLKPYLTTAEIRSVSENPMKPIRKSAVHMLAPTKTFGNRNIVVEIPNVRQPVPLFIVFRALGVISDKAIMEMCLLDLDKYGSMTDLFIPSVYDAGPIYTQYAAIQYITALTKYDTSPEYTREILCDYFLPHVGETNFVEKAYYLGYMVFRLLAVHTGLEEAVDRDHYKHKRLELTGTLLYDLFREYYRIQCDDHIMKTFEKRLYYNQDMYRDNLMKLVDDNFKDAFRERAVEMGFS